MVHLDLDDSSNQTIKYNDKKYLYAVLSRDNCTHPFPQAKIAQKLQIKITEIDIDSKDEIGSYEEDYEASFKTP